MRPALQTLFGGGTGGMPRGNCFAACVAAILELPLETVPNFCDRDDWRWFTNQWLAKLGLCYLDVKLPGDGRDELVAFWGHHVISGEGPRGHRHSVVGFEGRPVFDPHPEGGFLLGTLEEWEYGLFVRVFP